MKTNNLEIIVWVARDYPPASLSPAQFSWVKIDLSRVVEVLYKSPPPINNDDWSVISGNFSFSNRGVAIKLITELLSDDDAQINGEFYLDSIISITLQNGITIGALEIPDYFSLGTIGELQTFNYWSKVLKTNFPALDKTNHD